MLDLHKSRTSARISYAVCTNFVIDKLQEWCPDHEWLCHRHVSTRPTLVVRDLVHVGVPNVLCYKLADIEEFRADIIVFGSYTPSSPDGVGFQDS